MHVHTLEYTFIYSWEIFNYEYKRIEARLLVAPVERCYCTVVRLSESKEGGLIGRVKQVKFEGYDIERTTTREA
jgi:hypothetical protein